MSEERIRQFKNHGKDSQELRRRRNESMIELRKARKDEQLIKRRNIDVDEVEGRMSIHENGAVTNGEDGTTNNNKAAANTGNGTKENGSSYVDVITLAKITGDIFSGDGRREFVGCQMARKILSRERHPPIDPIISCGIVPKCIHLLKSPNFDTQFEAAWIITNIASGNSDQTSYLVEHGAIVPLIDMLKSPHMYLVEQSVWALGNIAGDGPKTRDLLIEKGIVPPLIALTKANSNTQFVRNIAWTFSNLCRSKQPSPPMEAAKMILTALKQLVWYQDNEVLSDACWALSYLSDGPNEKIEEVIKAGVVPRVIELLSSTDCGVVTPCLRTIGNIVTGSDTQTDQVLRSGQVLEILGKLLTSPKSNIAKEAAWAISNITAGTLTQINEVIQANIIPTLIKVIHTGDLRVQKEAVWTLTNITSGGSLEHIVMLCRLGAIPALCNMLKCKEWRAVVVAMDGLENILKGADEVGELEKIHVAVEECGGLDILEALQSHENNTLYSRAYTIVEKYFNTSDTMA